MLIKSLQLCNFRQYRQMQNINFVYEGEKNVTVILGKNTKGKTTLVQSFIWCLYGRETFDPGDELINVATKLKLLSSKIGDYANVSVQVVLTHNENEYVITRIRKYIKDKPDNVTPQKDKIIVNVKDKFGGQEEIEQDKIKDLINEILPDDLSDFFFFKGEKFEKNEKKNITDSVKKFMGLDILDKTRKLLSKTSKEFISEMNDADKANAIIVSKILSNKKIDEEIEKIKLKRSEAYDNYDNYHLLWEKDNEALLKNNVTAVSNAEKDIVDLQSKIKILNIRLEQNKSDYINAFCQNVAAFYAQDLARKTEKILDDNSEEIITYSNITAKTISEIISNKKCICGRPFCDGDETYKELIRISSLVPPNRIDNEVRSFKSYISGLRGSANYYLNNLLSKKRTILDTEEVIEDAYDKIEKNQKIVDEFPDASKLKQNADLHYKQYMEYYSEYSKLTNQIETLNKEKEANEKAIKRQRENLDDNSYQQKLSDYAQKAFESVDKEYKNNEMVIKSELQKYVSMYFDEMYNGSREAVLNDDYSITLFSIVEGAKVKVGTSPGIRTVRNFAFVAAMVEMAKEKISDIDESLTSEPYPLVLDAPFSATDEDHVPAISKLVSKVAEQTILVVMKKDWKYAEKMMSDKVGRYYTIEPLSEYESKIIDGKSEEDEQ